MRVYRCIKLQEVINKYVNKKNEKFGSAVLNTHEYKEGIEYIHFFRYDAFAKYYFDLGKDGSYDKKNDNYILFMTANIPEDILEKYQGFGFYSLDGEKIIIPEYAIPMEEFSPEFIVDITDKPRGFYTRQNEDEEYDAYIKLIKTLRQSNKDINDIAHFLLGQDFEALLGIPIDTRTEEEFRKEAEFLLSTLSFPDDDDIPIREFKK